MTVYLWYTLKASACLVVLYSFYSTFLRKSTYFTLNRIYLVTGLLLSCIIPVLKISILREQANLVLPGEINKILVAPDYDFFKPLNLPDELNSVNYLLMLLVIYLTGAFVMFFKFTLSIIKILRIKKKAEMNHLGKTKVIRMDVVAPFSFFNIIFLPKGETNPLIVQHEMAHIKQYHCVDLVIAEVVSVILWYNPFLILYKSSLKLQHEYLADHQVIHNSNPVENYLRCLLKHVQVVSRGRLASHFYCKTIKKRIIMITKNKTSIKYLGIYLLSLPIICILMFAFTGNDYKSGMVSFAATNPHQDDLPSLCPVDAKKVTQINGYGERKNPVTRKTDFHYGIDMAVPEGEKIIAPAKGMITEATFDKENKRGNYIIIKHNSEYSTFYSHLKKMVVKNGDAVEKGQVIGYVGNTGVSTGPHLHYEVIRNGERVNPGDYIPK